jgi:hypothetical protein
MGSLLKQLWLYFSIRKRFWLLPIFITLLLVGVLIIVQNSTAMTPFLYAIF